LHSQRLFPWPFVQHHRPRRLRQFHLRSAQAPTTLPICTMDAHIRTAGMDNTTDIAGTEITTIIDTIDTDAITTRNSDPFDERATALRQDLSWRGARRRTRCPIWVKSRHLSRNKACLLYSQKRTCAMQLGMSALGQKRTCAISFDQLVRAPD
jgi:hypothetical protein